MEEYNTGKMLSAMANLFDFEAAPSFESELPAEIHELLDEYDSSEGLFAHDTITMFDSPNGPPSGKSMDWWINNVHESNSFSRPLETTPPSIIPIESFTDVCVSTTEGDLQRVPSPAFPSFSETPPESDHSIETCGRLSVDDNAFPNPFSSTFETFNQSSNSIDVEEWLNKGDNKLSEEIVNTGTSSSETSNQYTRDACSSSTAVYNSFNGISSPSGTSRQWSDSNDALASSGGFENSCQDAIIPTEECQLHASCDVWITDDSDPECIDYSKVIINDVYLNQPDDILDEEEVFLESSADDKSEVVSLASSDVYLEEFALSLPDDMIFRSPFSKLAEISNRLEDIKTEAEEAISPYVHQEVMNNNALIDHDYCLEPVITVKVEVEEPIIFDEENCDTNSEEENYSYLGQTGVSGKRRRHETAKSKAAKKIKTEEVVNMPRTSVETRSSRARRLIAEQRQAELSQAELSQDELSEDELSQDELSQDELNQAEPSLQIEDSLDRELQPKIVIKLKRSSFGTDCDEPVYDSLIGMNANNRHDNSLGAIKPIHVPQNPVSKGRTRKPNNGARNIDLPGPSRDRTAEDNRRQTNLKERERRRKERMLMQNLQNLFPEFKKMKMPRREIMQAAICEVEYLKAENQRLLERRSDLREKKMRLEKTLKKSQEARRQEIPLRQDPVGSGPVGAMKKEKTFGVRGI